LGYAFFTAPFMQEDTLMLRAQLYFLSNEYYQDFPDNKLMQNKDTIDGVPHSRPCFSRFPMHGCPKFTGLFPFRPNTRNISVSNRIKSRSTVNAIPSASARFLAETRHSWFKICVRQLKSTSLRTWTRTSSPFFY